jgi:hypothetical protein
MKLRPMEMKYLIVTLALLGLSLGCGKKQVNLNPSASVPAATATAKLTKDSNGNTIVDLRVKNLAKPENLTPPKSVYIVWIAPRGGAPVKQGELQVNNKLDAHFSTPTTLRTFDIFVTAENDANVTQPSGPEVLRQTVMG